jgi:hypothetical protein
MVKKLPVTYCIEEILRVYSVSDPDHSCSLSISSWSSIFNIKLQVIQSRKLNDFIVMKK